MVCQVVGLQSQGAGRSCEKVKPSVCEGNMSSSCLSPMEANDREGSGKKLAQMQRRHHTGLHRDYVFTSVCISVYIHTGSVIKDEMGRNGLGTRGRVRVGLGHSWTQRKRRTCFPRNVGMSFSSVDSSGFSIFYRRS